MPTIEQLDASHRAEQAQNASVLSKYLLARWLLLVDPDRIADSSRTWLDEAIDAILQRRTRAWDLADAYAQAVHRIQIPGARQIIIPTQPPPPLEKIRTSLIYTGVRDLAIKLGTIPEPTDPAEGGGTVTESDRDRFAREREQWRQMRRKAMEVSGAKASAAAYRHVVDGGRALTDELVTTKVAVGWVRVTKANPCYFCAMLASRGPVFAEQSFDRSDPRFEGPGEYKVHDSCGCSLRPIYSRSSASWPQQSRDFEELWKNSGAKFSGPAAVSAFRRAYEGR